MDLLRAVGSAVKHRCGVFLLVSVEGGPAGERLQTVAVAQVRVDAPEVLRGWWISAFWNNKEIDR